MEFVTIRDLSSDVIANIHRIPKTVDVIVGVPRSGMLVASIIALYMNKPLADIDSFTQGVLYSNGKTKNTVSNVSSFFDVTSALIVEDSVNTGYSISEAKNKLRNHNQNINLLYLAAYVTKRAKDMVDIYFREIERPRLFEWNYLHSDLLSETCFDIDGVLCVDPTDKENDDGEKYLTFLKNTPIKLFPTKEIGMIITSRLEKYRRPTEEWLSSHEIKYKKLIMMPIDTAEERRRLGNHAEFKAKHYARSGKLLFVESSENQARVIAEYSGKPVFCTENLYYYTGNHLTTSFSEKKNSINKQAKRFLKRVLPKKLLSYVKGNEKK